MSSCHLDKDPNHNDWILRFSSSSKDKREAGFIPEDQQLVYRRYIAEHAPKRIYEELTALHEQTSPDLPKFSPTSIKFIARWIANNGKRNDLSVAQLQHWSYVGVPEAKRKWDDLENSNHPQTHTTYPSEEQQSVKRLRVYGRAYTQASGSGAQSSQSST